MVINKLLLNSKDVSDLVLYSAEKGKPLLLTYFNQHCFNIYTKNKIYKKIIDSNFIVYQADLGVYFALKLFFKKKIKKIDATKMNEIISRELISRKYTLAIVGGNFDEEFVKKESINRGINFVGYHNGYFNESKTDDVIEYLNNINYQVCLVGMGVPKQEIFAEKLSKTKKSKMIICVGNFLEFYFGTKKRAPVFIQTIGLEWLFRLITEPRRLWQRYLIGIPVFFYRIFKIKILKSDR